MDSSVERLIALLDEGDWEELEHISSPGGMMEGRSIHLSARRRIDQRRAYLKFIPEATEVAGNDTQLLTSSGRLEDIERTILEASEDEIPIVELLAGLRLPGVAGLLIAMPEVQTLHEVLKGTPDSPRIQHAMTVLETLNSVACRRWVHCDICPRNVGVGLSGDLALIDLDSLLCVDSIEGLDFRLLVGKPDRHMPRYASALAMRILQRKAQPLDLRLRHDAEVILLAAECCVGLLDTSIWTNEDSLKKFCGREAISRSLGSFWFKELSALGRGELPNPGEVLHRFKQCFGDTAPVSAAPPPPIAYPLVLHIASSPADAQNNSTEATPESREGDTFEELFERFGRPMRRLELSVEGMQEYMRRLETLTETRPSEREAWHELAHIAMGRLRNTSRVKELCQSALQKLGTDEELENLITLARMVESARSN